MSVFSKAIESISKNIDRALHKEQRGIYNVTYNGKFSTPIKKDLATLDEALRYAQGNKNKGAKHIKIKHHQPKTRGLHNATRAIKYEQQYPRIFGKAQRAIYR